MQYDDLLAELRSALDAGRVEEADVRRVLARSDRAHRPGPAGVLRAAGAIVFLLGLGLLFGLGYDDYPYAVQLVGPFVFPAAALGSAIGIHRRGGKQWEVQLAGMVGYVALGLAYLAAGAAADAGSGYGLIAAATALAVGLLLLRRNRDVAANELRTAALLAPMACAFGIGDARFGSFGLWHLALTATVAATLLAAAALDLPGLMWIGAADGLFWISAVAAAAGQSAGWAVAVM